MSDFKFVILLLFIVSVTALFCWKAKDICIISKHSFPKFVGGLLLLLLALISFIFGIHADILSSYDRLSNKLAGSYNWFNPADIVRFPIDQFKLNNKDFSKDNVPIDIDTTLTQEYDRKYTIVVDKSLSTKPDAFTRKVSAELRAYLNTELQGSMCQNKLPLDSLSTEDLIVITAMNQLSGCKASKTTLEVLYYLGDTTFLSPFDIDITIGGDNLCNYAKQYVDFINSTVPKSKCGLYTDFDKMIQKLLTKAYLGDKSTKFTNLYILSDFDHDSNSDISRTELKNSFQALNSLNLNQVNLIKMKGTKTNPERVNWTLELFRKSFNHLYFFEFNEDLMYYNKNPVNVISYMFSSTTPDSLQQGIYLYYLWNDENINYDFIGAPCFTSKGDRNLLVSLRDKVNAEKYADLSGYLLFNGYKDKVYPFSITQMTFDNSKQIPTTFTTEKKESRTYYLEIANPGNTFKVSEPIILRQVLPITSCIYLFYLYAFFFIGIIALCLYYIMYLWKLFAQESKLERGLVFCIAALLIFMVIPPLMDILPSYFNIWVNGPGNKFKIVFFISIVVYSLLNYFYFNFSFKQALAKPIPA